MATASIKRRFANGLALLPALLLPALAGWPDAALSQRAVPQRLSSAPTEDPDGARVIVKYKALGGLMRAQSVPAAGAAAGTADRPRHAAMLAGRTGLKLSDGRVIDRHSQVVRGDKSLSSAALAARLATDPDVEFAVPDLRRHALALPNDPLFAAGPTTSPAAGQWYLRAPDATFVSAINAVAAWELTPGLASIVVADVDTGVLFSHPDLINKLHPGYDFVSDAKAGGDGSGRDGDATDPGDWTTASDSCGAANSSWHGTQTSGLIAAQTGNAVGMASVGHDVMVLPVRVLGKCGGFDSDIIAGMLWAGGVTNVPTTNPHPARVINMSLGSTGSCLASYSNAISQLTAKGVVVVVAAGNEVGLAVGMPANCAGVIAVTGVRHVGTKVGFSSIGPQVAIAAPAGNCVNAFGPCLYPILTTTNTGTTTASTNTYSDSSNFSVGTSFATPMVAGTVALMLSTNPSLSPAQVMTLLQSSARPFPATSSDASVAQCQAPNGVEQIECLCTTSTCGAGLLDAGAAVAAAAAVATPSAVISTASGSPTLGGSVVLSGTASTAIGGRSVVSYQWALTSGGELASFTSATNASTVTLATTAAGSVVVSLTVTDSSGGAATTRQTLLVAAPPVAVISLSDPAPAAGSPVTMVGTASSAAAGRSIASYQWAIVSGADLASFAGASNASTVTLVTVAAGLVELRLTVVDSAGASASSRQSLTVAAAPVVVRGGGGGGGAMGLGWMFGLAGAIVLLARRRPG
jgi:serine protease